MGVPAVQESFKDAHLFPRFAHNEFVHIGVELGVVGMLLAALCIAWLMLRLLLLATKSAQMTLLFLLPEYWVRLQLLSCMPSLTTTGIFLRTCLCWPYLAVSWQRSRCGAGAAGLGCRHGVRRGLRCIRS